MTEQPNFLPRTIALMMALAVAGFVIAKTGQAQDTPSQPAASDKKSEGDSQPAATDTAPEGSEESKEKPKQEKLQKVVVAEKRVELSLPAHWKQRETQNNIIEMEFAVLEREPKEGEKEETIPAGRVTLSSSGGSVDQNMRRWIGQFRLGHDDDGEDAIEQEVIELEGATLHLLDIAGTYFDAPRGPFGPKIERPDYRMLGAIIEIENGPLYFVKFYGPEKIVEANAKAFRKAVDKVTIHPASDEEAEDEATANPKTNE
jgi:hypothetical protein